MGRSGTLLIGRDREYEHWKLTRPKFEGRLMKQNGRERAGSRLAA